MHKASEAILALKPVTFHYESDNTNRPEFGLIAEQVAKANSDLVVRDNDGEIYTVHYDAVNAMLLNEFSQRASQSAGIGSERRRAAKGNQSSRSNGERAGRANPESERAA
jgi:hypothetical protein